MTGSFLRGFDGAKAGGFRVKEFESTGAPLSGILAFHGLLTGEVLVEDQSFHSAIRALVMKRQAQGTISTASVIRELKREFPDLPEPDRELENAVARHAIQNGLQVRFGLAQASNER